MMPDKRMELLTLLSPGPKHAADIALLAGDLGVSRNNVEQLVARLQAAGFGVACHEGRVWINRSDWPDVQRAAEQYLDRHPD